MPAANIEDCQKVKVPPKPTENALEPKAVYRLLLAYDGTRYFGWQTTRMGPSIQATLSDALFAISRERVIPEAASRTDRGVHAEAQSVAFSLAKEWDPVRLRRGLNSVLPPDIRVVQVERGNPSFHPTLHARQKEYHYRLCLGPVQEPIYRLYSWHFRFPLDLAAMEEGSAALLGTRDFAALANEPEKNPICHLQSIRFEPLERNRLQIALISDRFLYKMARNLAGTLLYVGCGKLSASSIPALLDSRDRKQAGITAPAHGLFLHRVDYKD